MTSTLIVFKVGLNWIWRLPSLIPVLGKLKQKSHCDIKAYLGYTLDLRLAWATEFVLWLSLPSRQRGKLGLHSVRVGI